MGSLIIDLFANNIYICDLITNNHNLDVHIFIHSFDISLCNRYYKKPYKQIEQIRFAYQKFICNTAMGKICNPH